MLLLILISYSKGFAIYKIVIQENLEKNFRVSLYGIAILFLCKRVTWENGDSALYKGGVEMLSLR